MVRKISLIVIASLFVFGMNRLSFAMMCGEHSEQAQLAQAHSEHEHGTAEAVKGTDSEEAVHVGNKICPVSGEKIDEEKKVTYEHEGKIYNLCCKACAKDFKKDPQKYIKKVEEELEAGSKEETEGMKMMQKPTSSQGMHEEHHHGGDKGQHHQ